MRNLVLQMQISVDGFVSGPKGEIDWVFKSLDDAATTGRGRHHAGARECHAGEGGVGRWVGFSLAVRRGGLARRRIETSLAEGIARLKQEPGEEILAHGGAGFARRLVATGLVDELRLLVHPVALGRGLPLFSELARPLDLVLVSATPFPAGTIAQVYRPA